MTVGTGGIAAGMGGPMQEADDEMVDLDLGDEDELGGDEDGLGGDELGDLGDDHGDMGLGGEDAIEVTCPSCNDTITVRLVPEVEEGGMGDDMGDMGGMDDTMDHVDLDAEGETDFGDDLPVKDECMEGVDPKVIANLLTDDPDIFTK